MVMSPVHVAWDDVARVRFLLLVDITRDHRLEILNARHTNVASLKQENLVYQSPYEFLYCSFLIVFETFSYYNAVQVFCNVGVTNFRRDISLTDMRPKTHF